MLKSALAIAAFAASALLPLPALAENNECFRTSGGDKVCYMRLAEVGHYVVAIYDAAALWPVAMRLTCYTDGTNKSNWFGDALVGQPRGIWYADEVCKRI